MICYPNLEEKYNVLFTLRRKRKHIIVGNSIDNNLKHIEIDEKTFLDFNEGRKQTFEYKVIEDVKLNGKMHVVPTDIDFIDPLQHKKGKIPSK